MSVEGSNLQPLSWVVFGHEGWIGRQVMDILLDRVERYGDRVYGAGIRADNAEDVEELLLRVKPDHVLSLLGRTHGPGHSTIDYLEQPGKLVENVRDNLYAPFVLARTCEKLGIHLTYLGTGCIFTYDADHVSGDVSTGFHESDVPNFFGSSYSIVKGFTDRMMHQLPGVLNVRIRMPITADVHSRNFITKITQYAKVCSIPNSMTVLPDLLPILVDMSAKRMVGTINLTNPGVITHNEILEMYRTLVDPTFTWENFTQQEQRAVLHSERSNNCLDTARLEQLYPNVRPIQDAMREVLLRMRIKDRE